MSRVAGAPQSATHDTPPSAVSFAATVWPSYYNAMKSLLMLSKLIGDMLFMFQCGGVSVQEEQNLRVMGAGGEAPSGSTRMERHPVFVFA